MVRRTYDEWRALFEPTFQKTLEDIYKNLIGDGVPAERDDVSQHLELDFLKRHNCFILGECDGHGVPPRYVTQTFPPPGVLFYKENYHDCMALFILKHPRGDMRIELRSPELIDIDEDFSYNFDESRGARLEDEQELRLCEYLDKIGLAPDDPLGPEFSLWWIGMTYEEISLNKRLFGAPGSVATVKRRMSKVFEELERRGISRKCIKQRRNACLRAKT